MKVNWTRSIPTQGALGAALVLMAITTVMVAATVTPTPVVADDAPMPLVVAESGYGEDRTTEASSAGGTDRRRGTSALVLTNPNEGQAAETVRLELRLLAADGSTIRTAERVLAQVLPGESQVLVESWTLLPSEPAVAAVAAEDVRVGRWVAVRAVPLPAVIDVRPNAVCASPAPRPAGPVPSGFCNLAVTGRVQNRLDATIAEVTVAVAAIDREGKVTGGGSRRIAILEPLASQSIGTLIIGPSQPGPALPARVIVSATYPWIDLTPYRR